MSESTIERLAVELRDEAVGQLADGEIWAPEDALPGTWEHVAEELGREPTAAEAAIFWKAYASAPDPVEDLHRKLRGALGVGPRERAATARALGMSRQTYQQALQRGVSPKTGLLRALLDAGCEITLYPDGEIEIVGRGQPEPVDGIEIVWRQDTPEVPVPGGFARAQHWAIVKKTGRKGWPVYARVRFDEIGGQVRYGREYATPVYSDAAIDSVAEWSDSLSRIVGSLRRRGLEVEL